MNSIIITGEGAVVFINSTPHTVSVDHPHYEQVISAARSNEWDTIPDMLNLEAKVVESIIQTGNPNLTIKNGVVTYKHTILPDELSGYILNIIRDKFDLTPIINFVDNLLANPDHRVFQQLFGFLIYGKNPITPEGNLLAYKKVRDDYTSCHDRTTSHKIGETVELPREKCNANPEETCSTGLHFCSREYLDQFSGDRVVVVEINPADVVSIPVDYNNTKGRACKYKVVGELTDGELVTVKTTDTLKTATVETKYQDQPTPVPELKVVSIEPNSKDGVVTPDQINAYLLGYGHGRTKVTTHHTDIFYMLGYKHGKNKKRKLYS